MLVRHISLFAPLALALCALPVAAQDAERMVEVVENEVQSGVFMGNVLVAKGDTVLLDQAYGSANLEWNLPHTTASKFRIGSVTKQFTAVAILLLQEQGKLDLDDPVSKHLADAPEAWAPITVRNLLRHTSGITNVTSLDDFGTFKFTPITQDELIAKFSDKPLEFEPGSKWSYSNSNYVLLSRIVENASGESYEAFLRANIFDPLGMASTAIDVSSAIVPMRAAGYSPAQNDKVVNAEYVNMAIPTGAGALYSTTSDLLKWQRGLFGGKVLNEQSLAEYLTPSPHDAVGGAKYAHGVLVSEDDEGATYWHGGGIEGFNAWLGHAPQQDVTVVVLANLNGGTASKLGSSLMKLARGGEVVLPGEREVQAVDPASFAQYVGIYALAPGFTITVTENGENLVAQATGQSAFPIFAEGEDRFFYKVVDAQIRFDRGEDGSVSGLTLFQNGQELPAPRQAAE